MPCIICWVGIIVICPNQAGIITIDVLYHVAQNATILHVYALGMSQVYRCMNNTVIYKYGTTITLFPLPFSFTPSFNNHFLCIISLYLYLLYNVLIILLSRPLCLIGYAEELWLNR